jgi:transposase
MADLASDGLDCAASGAAGEGDEREGDPPLGGGGVAEGKKNARRQRAWMVFEDESGISERPPIRRTWAPRGQTPVVTHPYRWNKVSVAGALAYRWDGRRCRLFFTIKPDSFNAPRLVQFLKGLKRHFRGRRVILLWDRLPGHKAALMSAYLATQRDWLKVEWLPAYAPELNPVEFLWGHAKGGELANKEAEDVEEMIESLRHELLRARRRDLGFSFLEHAGLSVG